jgi:20S proteasome subunit beta 5
MDSLVSRYSRPAFENEGYSEDEQLELSDPNPSLSLKFAMPPVAQVSAHEHEQKLFIPW